MDTSKLNDWMQVLGIFAVVASLIFVGLQMRQDRAIAIAEAFASRSVAVTELAALIGSNKALWISGLNGDELQEEDEAAFQAMAEAVESYFVAMEIRQSSIGGSLFSRARNVEQSSNYAFALYLHKGLRRVWNVQLDYWRLRDSAFNDSAFISPAGGYNFRSRVDAELSQLVKDAPPKPEEKRYVFW